jgi:hypothetical protein
MPYSDSSLTLDVRLFFKFKFVKWGVESRSTRHCGHQWPIVPTPCDYYDGELVEWLAGETEVLGKNLPQYRFVHHKPHMQPGREPQPPPRWEASV